MTLELSAKWDAFVKDKVAAGEFTSPHAVLEAALSQMESAQGPAAVDSAIEWPEPEKLRAPAIAGWRSIEAGRVSDGHEVVARLRERLKRKRT